LGYSVHQKAYMYRECCEAEQTLHSGACSVSRSPSALQLQPRADHLASSHHETAEYSRRALVRSISTALSHAPVYIPVTTNIHSLIVLLK